MPNRSELSTKRVVFVSARAPNTCKPRPGFNLRQASIQGGLLFKDLRYMLRARCRLGQSEDCLVQTLDLSFAQRSSDCSLRGVQSMDEQSILGLPELHKPWITPKVLHQACITSRAESIRLKIMLHKQLSLIILCFCT